MKSAGARLTHGSKPASTYSGSSQICGDALAAFRVGDDDQPLALAEAGARRTFALPRRCVRGLTIDRPVGIVVADHASATNDLVELHRGEVNVHDDLVASLFHVGWK